MEQLKQIFGATVRGFETSLYQHMPLSVYRNFNVWALSSKNPHVETWLQIVGIPQFAKLTQTLLGDSVTEDKWADLVRYTTYMNSYLIYETISDNLAFGLAACRPDDTSYELRRNVLIDFNNAMIARLKGNRAESDNILAGLRGRVELISGFKHSLTAHEQQTIAEAFLHEHPNYNRMDDIEFGTWNALVANIESCAELVDRWMANFRLGGYLRQGLIQRYEAVNDLICRNVINQEMLVKVSINTILVIPVLTYYIAVLTEALDPSPWLDELLGNDSLFQALEDAALMVRLLNDLGTNLVATDQFHPKLLNDLYAQLSAAHGVTFPDVLMHHSEESKLMTRIRKDISFAEFNVSLHDLMTSPPTSMALLLFGNNLIYFRRHYRECQARLSANLQTITQILRSDTVSTLIADFVRFHEHIYQHHFDEQAGDYATKPDMPAAAG